jgi:hypothetical protein
MATWIMASGDIEPLLEVADETARSDQPAEPAFDDSPAGQLFEAWFAVDVAHNLDDEVQ